MPRSADQSVATMGIDIGTNSFHVVGLDQRGAIVVREPVGEHATLLIGMEACVGAGQWGRSRRLRSVWRGCASSGRFALDCGVHFRAE